MITIYVGDAYAPEPKLVRLNMYSSVEKEISMKHWLLQYRLVPSRFSCTHCGLCVGFDEFAVHQGKDGRKLRGFARLPKFQCENE